MVEGRGEPSLETQVDSAAETLVRATPSLVGRENEREIQVLVDRRLVVGSAEGADLRLTDRMVSRVHASIELREDGVWVRDLGSRNGTWVNDVLIEHARVPNRGRIRFGRTTLTLSFERGEKQSVDLWPSSKFGRMLGGSTVMRALFATLSQIAATDAPVLVHGETGSGKELVAEAIHGASRRSDGPLVTLDCASLPETLLEAELFGHAKGAFTGAHQTREGVFEAGRGGTVFLDEIGELPLSMQPKLLRVLESKKIRRVGETAQRDVDVRVICATHRDLARMVSAGSFREDLYFRLAVLPVNVPPLRARRDDFRALLEHFFGRSDLPLGDEVVTMLAEREWPGNVRELRNFVERFKALGPERALAMLGVGEVSEATEQASAPESYESDYRTFREMWIDRGEAEYVRRLLERHDGNVSEAARHAGLARTYLHRLIKKHEL